jgi:hypothetical protein
MNHEEFRKLVELKFDNKRGYIGRAAIGLGVNQGNLSSMLLGKISIPQKYVDALMALPDYCPPVGITRSYEEYVGGGGRMLTTFATKLTLDAEKKLRLLARMQTPPNYDMPDLNADPDATARFFELLLDRAAWRYREEYADVYFAALEADKAQSKQESEEFIRGVKSKAYLVADELSANALNDDQTDEDPLA